MKPNNRKLRPTWSRYYSTRTVIVCLLLALAAYTAACLLVSMATGR